MRPGYRPALRRPALLLSLLLLGQLVARAQTIGAWFQTAAEAADYAALRPLAENLAAEAAATGVPPQLLLQRLEEGAQKRVPAEHLAAALRNEALLLENAATALAVRSALPREEDRRAALLGQISLLRRAGIEAAELTDALDTALNRRGPGEIQSARGGGSVAADRDRALAALAALVAVDARLHLPPSDRRALTEALILSSLSDEGFSKLAGLLDRYSGTGSDVTRATSLIIEALRSGSTAEGAARNLETGSRSERQGEKTGTSRGAEGQKRDPGR